jgi:hypothetical protein
MPVPAREIGDDEYVSQYGSLLDSPRAFRDRPRLKDLGAVSVILGRILPAQARKLVRFAGAPAKEDGVRHARVGDLRRAGFVVGHAPSGRNPDHARVRYAAVEWDDEVAGRFRSCFTEPVWYEEPEGGTE